MKTRMVILAFLLAGCGARVGHRLIDSSNPPHSNKVCMMDGLLPPGVEFREIGVLHSYMNHYGDVESVLEKMADDARHVGADAVVAITANQRVGWWIGAIVRPVADGKAVKLLSKFDCPGKLR
jgi:hypothetical protein